MKHQLKAQRQGGKLLAQIKKRLIKAAQPHTTLEEIDQLAEKLLLKTGGQPSFKMVPGYFWSTCINLNQGIVHGIPASSLKIHSGDLVTIDVGLYYQGFHTDTSTSFVVGPSNPQLDTFLQTGQATLHQAIAQARPGNSVWDISHTIQQHIEAAGYSVVRDLTGHGVGKQLHQPPAIPCYINRPKSSYPTLTKGQTIAIEVMYTQGNWRLQKDLDGWTLATADNSLSAVFEETVIVNAAKPEAVTQIS